MLGRRQFLIAGSYLAAVPALLATVFTAGDAQAATEEAPGGDETSAVALKPDAQLMRIQGWESPGETDNAGDDQLWVRMNASWRGDWR